MADKDDGTNDTDKEGTDGLTIAASTGLAKAMGGICQSNPLSEGTAKTIQGPADSIGSFPSVDTSKFLSLSTDGPAITASARLAKTMEGIYQGGPLSGVAAKAARGLTDSIGSFPSIDTSKLLQHMGVLSDDSSWSLPSYDHASYEVAIRPSWHQLVIIGNGFDLECGLPSGFGNFAKVRQEYFLEGRQEQVGENGESAEPLTFAKTIWDEVLGNLGNGNWCDVESAIARWLVPEAKGKSLLDRTLAKLEEEAGSRVFLYDPEKLEDVVARYLHDIYLKSCRSWPTKERLLEITHEDLGKLEHDFACYLENAVEQTEGYHAKARQLMCELIHQERPSKKGYDIEESVLSFNYTQPVKDLRSDEHDISFVNIHGKLGGEIVFGIDGTDRMSDPGVMPFTKTYRLMALDLPDIGSLVRTAPATPSMDYGTVMIKFYGHSLGEADYSYFQAIFDAVRLYEGDTRLIFYFRSHDGVDESSARSDMMQKAIRLLAAYGNTLDNKDHGKNLIHKLLIEGRLSVKPLPDTVRHTS